MTSPKTPNHELSAMQCPEHLEDVNLFGRGAQEHWYEAYDILHSEAPVHRLPGEGFLPGTDAFILTRLACQLAFSPAQPGCFYSLHSLK